MRKTPSFLRAACRVQAVCLALSLPALLARSAIALRAAPESATVTVGGQPLTFVVSPYVNEKGEVVGPVDFVRSIGGGYTPHSESGTVSIAGASGKSVVVPYTLVHQRCFVPMQAVATALGARADWMPAQHLLAIKSRLETVKHDGDTLSINTTYPVTYQIRTIQNPARIYVDLFGLDTDAKPETISSESGNVYRIRTGHVGPDTVRVVIDLKKSVSFKVASANQTDHVAIQLESAPDGISQQPTSGGNTAPIQHANAANNPSAQRPSVVANALPQQRPAAGNTAPLLQHSKVQANAAPPSAEVLHIGPGRQEAIVLHIETPRQTATRQQAVAANSAAAGNGPGPESPRVASNHHAFIPSAPLTSRGHALVTQNISDASIGIAPPGSQSTDVPPSGLHITSVSFRKVSDSASEVEVKTTGNAKYRTTNLSNPSRLAFDLEGADLDDGVQRALQADSSNIKSVRAGIVNTADGHYGRVVMDLSHPVSFAVNENSDQSGTTYLITLNDIPTVAPRHIEGSLAGKIIMVDPGHGGSDTGAIGIGGIFEKDLTLAISRKLRDTLVAAGAKVYMTRDEDVKPSLAERPRMAISVGADFFISVHCDESGATNSHSGTTVYYHANNQACRKMAQVICEHVGAVCAIPPLGTKSDYIRFNHIGFAVLRSSPMPAVLVECGYMNNEADLARLTNEDTQQHIAEGIVEGLLDYIGSAGNR